MAEFKCISCGAVQESEESCICPVCGYKMLEMPYDKEEALKREIRDFIEKLRLTEVNGDFFEFFREVHRTKPVMTARKKLRSYGNHRTISVSLTIARFKSMYALQPKQKCSANGWISLLRRFASIFIPHTPNNIRRPLKT